jgi:hypothetical protein
MNGREDRRLNLRDSFGLCNLLFTRTVGIIGIATSLFLITVSLWGQSAEADTSHPAGKVIFKIGQEDKDDIEFTGMGLKGVHEFICTVGSDCTAEAFPKILYLTPGIPDHVDDWGVARVSINFKLDQDYKQVVLRLARAGAESSSVLVDGKQTYIVTNEMLGSDERLVCGAYNLSLGSLNKGTHTIQLTVVDDGKGNGRYQWDALTLFAE